MPHEKFAARSHPCGRALRGLRVINALVRDAGGKDREMRIKPAAPHKYTPRDKARTKITQAKTRQSKSRIQPIIHAPCALLKQKYPV
jgi:hypothetical protein